MRFLVHVPATCVVVHAVDAETESEAIFAVASGKGEIRDQDRWKEDTNTNNWEVEEDTQNWEDPRNE